MDQAASRPAHDEAGRTTDCRAGNEKDETFADSMAGAKHGRNQMTSKNMPWSKFYWSDWRSDPNLSRCSHAAKGFWMDLLAMAYECEEPGVLATNGHAWTDDEIARAIPGDPQANACLLLELLDKNVARRNEDGAVFSPRIVRDEEHRADIAQKRAIAGSKGGSKRQAKHKQTPKQTLSNSISNSKYSESETELQKLAEEIYRDYPRRIGKQAALKAIRKAMVDHDPPWLLERVRLFAKSPAGNAGDFTPHPATWFNAGRYDDDPAEWKSKGNGKAAVVNHNADAEVEKTRRANEAIRSAPVASAEERRRIAAELKAKKQTAFPVEQEGAA